MRDDRITRWLLGLALALAAGSTAWADGSGAPLLVVSSNASIAKYGLLETELRRHYAGEVIAIDLGSKWQDKSWLKEVLRRKQPQWIVCIGSRAYLETRELVRDVPIIFTSALNWQRFEIGDKTRVISSEVPALNQLTLFRILFPRLRRVGVLFSEADNREWFEKAKQAAKEVGIEVVGVGVARHEELKQRLTEVLAASDALWLVPDPLVLAETRQVEEIFRQSEARRRPVFTYDKLFVPFGAALVVSADIPTMARQAVAMTQQAGTDSRAAVEPAGSYIAVDAQRLARYGIELDQSMLSIVNELIAGGP